MNHLLESKNILALYNYALFMKQQSNSSTQLIKIRREQRHKELQQVRNTLRFMIVAKDYSQDHHPYQTFQSLTQCQLQQILTVADLNRLYNYAAQQDYQNEEIFQKYAIDIIHFLKQRLSIPLAALTLSCLIKKLDIYNVLAYNQQIISKIVYQMSILNYTIQAQSIYIWTLCAATERPELVQIQQIKHVLPILQQILKDLLINEEKQDYILVQLLKNLSEIKLIFSQSIVLDLIAYFWKNKRQTLLLNIYFISINLLKNIAFEPTTKVIIHLVVVYLKGKTKITTNLDPYVPALYNMMITVLKNYKAINEYMNEDQIQIDDAKITTNLHSFLLQYESELFKKNEHSAQYLSFLAEFCAHSPVHQTLKNWFEFGTIEHIVNILTVSPQTCQFGLKILHTLSYRAHYEQRDHLMLGAIKQYCKIQMAIQQTIFCFQNAKLKRLAQQVLQLFSQTT